VARSGLKFLGCMVKEKTLFEVKVILKKSKKELKKFFSQLALKNPV